MHLVAPNGRKRKHDIRFRNHDGRVVVVAGDRDYDAARRLGERIMMLVKAKHDGDPPPAELQKWIDNMPQARADKLLELGLLDRRRVEQNLSLLKQIEKFEKVIASRKTNSPTHAMVQANRVRRIVKHEKFTSLDGINEDDVLAAVGSWGLAVSSRHHYLVAMKDFTKWAAKSGRAAKNPLADLKPPGQYEDPKVERIP